MNMRKDTKMGLTAAALVLVAWTFLRAQSSGFRFRGLLDRFVTPTVSGLNQYAIFCLDNPSDSAVDARIFDLSGAQVAIFGPPMPLPSGSECPTDSVVPTGPEYIAWNGQSHGAAVRSGVYLYQIRSEGLTYTGTLVVVR